MSLSLLKNRLLTTFRILAATALLSLGSTAVAEQENTEAEPVHEAIQQADASREQEKQRKRYLLMFPATVVVIIAGLLILTRRRK